MLYVPKNWRLVTLSLFFIILRAISANALHHECPEPVDIYPCYCEDEEDQASLHCNHFSEPDQIYKAVKGLQGHKIFQMAFFMNRILEPVRSDAFKDLSVERILFENSTISLASPQFEGAENHLKSIQLRACFNSTNPLNSLSLGHLKHLRELTVDKNRIMTLPDEWVTSVPASLKTLTIEDNSIVRLGDNVFSKMENIVFVILDGNRLTGLKRTMFPKPAEGLRSLSLNYNQLRFLPYDLFTEMPNLRIVEIQYNRMTTLEKSIWSDMWLQLSKLDLTDNPLECDRSLKWMIASERKPILLYGECQSPDNLKGKNIKHLRIEDLH